MKEKIRKLIDLKNEEKNKLIFEITLLRHIYFEMEPVNKEFAEKAYQELLKINLVEAIKINEEI